jgi:hypothetical protein
MPKVFMNACTCTSVIAGMHSSRKTCLTYYRYCQKWVDLFDAEPKMIEIETAHYIKGLHNLMSAHFDLRNYQKFNDDHVFRGIY